MTSTGCNITLAIGMVIFAFGLIGPFGPVGIGLGIGMVIGSQRRNRAKAGKQMTAKENDQLITAVLPVITNNRK